MLVSVDQLATDDAATYTVGRCIVTTVYLHSDIPTQCALRRSCRCPSTISLKQQMLPATADHSHLSNNTSGRLACPAAAMQFTHAMQVAPSPRNICAAFHSTYG